VERVIRIRTGKTGADAVGGRPRILQLV